MSQDTELRPGGAIEDEAPARGAGLVWGLRAAGLVLAAVVWVALGNTAGLSADGRAVAAVATLMAVWWITEAVPLSVTSLLPIVLFPLVTDLSITQAAAPFASPTIFLFLGGFLIAIAMEKVNLHRRVALLTLKGVGVTPRRIVLGMMLATGFLSMWVSNTATALMMLPIGMSVLALVTERTRSTAQSGADVSEGLRAGGTITEVVKDPDIATFGVCLMLGIAWAASIGGLGTLLGSPPNAILAGYAADTLGRPVTFFSWMMVGLPLAVVFLLLAWVVMTRVAYRFDLPAIPGGREMIDREIRALGPVSQGEKVVIGVFLFAAFMWIVPPLLNSAGLGEALGVFGRLSDATIALIAGVLLFILPSHGLGRMVLEWKDAEKGLPWGVLLLFGGGLSMAASVDSSGLDEWIGAQVQGLGTLPTIGLVVAVTAMVLFMTEVTSNTATAATLIPILGGVAAGIGADPFLLLVPATLAATCAFMLPVGTPPNAIVFGTGTVTIAQMARGGFIMNLLGIALIVGIMYTIGAFAFGIAL